MAQRKRNKKEEAAQEPVSPVASVSLPERPRAEHVSVGVEQPPNVDRPRLMRADMAGSESKLFPKGGKAFSNWCQSKGINPRDQRSAEDWADLLTEFANRPIYGLRRGPDGGNHRPNPEALK